MTSSVRVGSIVTVVCGASVACAEQPSSERPIEARIVTRVARRGIVIDINSIVKRNRAQASRKGEAVSHQMKIFAALLSGHRDRITSLRVYRDFSIHRGCAW